MLGLAHFVSASVAVKLKKAIQARYIVSLVWRWYYQVIGYSALIRGIMSLDKQIVIMDYQLIEGDRPSHLARVKGYVLTKSLKQCQLVHPTGQIDLSLL